jgi:hypothetical protein
VHELVSTEAKEDPGALPYFDGPSNFVSERPEHLPLVAPELDIVDEELLNELFPLRIHLIITGKTTFRKIASEPFLSGDD